MKGIFLCLILKVSLSFINAYLSYWNLQWCTAKWSRINPFCAPSSSFALLFTFSFLFWSWFIFSSGRTARIPADKSPRFCFLQRAGNVTAPSWLIRGAEPCWEAAIREPLLQRKWVFRDTKLNLRACLTRQFSGRMTLCTDIITSQAVVIYTLK